MASTSYEEKQEDKWLEAYYDPIATINTFTSCIALADLSGDGDVKLLIADLGTEQYNMKLKVYKGTSIITESAIIDLPTAVVPLFMDNIEPRVPAVCLASGRSVFVYKNSKPYYKFVLPSMSMSAAEEEIWQAVKRDTLDKKSLTEALEALSNQLTITKLSSRSQRFLFTPEPERDQFLATYKNEPVKKHTVITAATTLKKSSQERDSVDCLVLGTESGMIYVLDSEAFTIMADCLLPAAPSFICAAGIFDVEYRIFASCRNCSVYSIRRGVKEVSKPSIELDTHIVGMSRISKTITLGCMDSTLRGYSMKGKRLWTQKLPGKILTMDTLDYVPKNQTAVIVGLDNAEIHIYKDMFLVDKINLGTPVGALKFGSFGREEGALIAIHTNGGLSVRLLKRNAKFEERAMAPGPPASQNQRLNIPKKTKVFVDQTIREREEYKKMHQTFQRDLFLLRLETAKSYVKTLEAGTTPMSQGGSNSDEIKLSVEIQGFGPDFILKVFLQCLSAYPAIGHFIAIQYNNKLYDVQNPHLPAPFLAPGLSYPFDVHVRCISIDKGLSEDIKVMVLKTGITVPLITALVSMPVSEAPLIDG